VLSVLCCGVSRNVATRRLVMSTLLIMLSRSLASRLRPTLRLRRTTISSLWQVGLWELDDRKDLIMCWKWTHYQPETCTLISIFENTITSYYSLNVIIITIYKEKRKKVSWEVYIHSELLLLLYY